MTIQEYQIAAARTCNDLGSVQDNAMHMKLGIYTEVGELLDVIKKHHAYGKPMDIVNIGEEIADGLHYVANWATQTGVELSEVTVKPVKLQSVEACVRICEDILVCTVGTRMPPSKDFFTARILNYQAVAAYFDLDFGQILQNNIDKLLIRYPNGFDSEKAVSRNLDRERAELEKQ